jgi:multiple sugar transport system substrate-binding protein
MTMLSRIASAFGAMAIGALVLAGTGHAQSKDELVVLSSFAPNDPMGPGFAAAVKSFTEKTGIPVRTVFSGVVELYNAYEAAVLAGQEPDVLIVNLYDKALDWTENGATFPVTDYVHAWGLDKVILPAALADWTDAKGRVVALPYRGFTWPVWYNTALLKRAGIADLPKTYDELLDAAGKLKAAGIVPFAIGGSDWAGEKFLLQLIQLTVQPDETKKLMASGGYCASPAAMKGIAEFIRLRDGGVFIKDAEGLTADNMYASFFQGEAAMMPSGSWEFSKAPPEMISDIVLGGFPLPAGSTFEKPVAYQAFSAAGIWITRNSQKRMDDFRAFVEHMYSPEVTESFVETAGDVPVVKLKDPAKAMAKQPLLLQAVEQMPKIVDYGVFPDFYVPGSKTQTLINATSTAFAPGATAEAICGALDAVYQ